jgi:hypothetical protein
MRCAYFIMMSPIAFIISPRIAIISACCFGSPLIMPGPIMPGLMPPPIMPPCPII